MTKTDGALVYFNLEIGMIPTSYQTTKYFNVPRKGALGLMPQIGSNL